jgi:hypothetical protein
MQVRSADGRHGPWPDCPELSAQTKASPWRHQPRKLPIGLGRARSVLGSFRTWRRHTTITFDPGGHGSVPLLTAPSTGRRLTPIARQSTRSVRDETPPAPATGPSVCGSGGLMARGTRIPTNLREWFPILTALIAREVEMMGCRRPLPGAALASARASKFHSQIDPKSHPGERNEKHRFSHRGLPRP